MQSLSRGAGYLCERIWILEYAPRLRGRWTILRQSSVKAKERHF
jgi:hypothetical protein